MKGKYHLVQVKPTIDLFGNTAWDAGDVLFDWYPFEIPRGGCCIKSMSVMMPGTNGAAATGIDMEIFFAKSVNGVAPTTLGDTDSAITLINATACRNNIIGHKFLDASAMENSDELVGYNIWTNTAPTAVDYTDINIVLEGEPGPYRTGNTYSATTSGYQTIWIAALTIGTPDFGTAVLLNQAGNQAVSTTAVDLVVDGTDADDVFCIGDELISFVAADGTSPAVIGTVTSIPDADSIVVDKVETAFNDDTEIVFRRPVTFNLGIEY